MSVFELALVLSTLLCSLVAGFLFAYTTVIMPGIGELDDKSFIKAFQVTDRVIQDNHPVFMLVWAGSVIAIIVCAITAVSALEGLNLFLLLLAVGLILLACR